MKRILLVLLVVLGASRATSQTDMTSKLTNPDFEEGLTGWVQYGMWTQGNDVFTGKSGAVYVERWTWKGNSAGPCLLRQEVKLPMGVYVLKASAQNIQEDTPKVRQSGACIFVEGAETAVHVNNDYEVRFAIHATTGATVKLGFRAINATGNYICVDNFRLTQVSDQEADALAERDVMEYEALNRAALQSNLEKATGTAPKVTTDTRYARGSDIAFCRLDISGSQELLEQGVCWSTSPEPTVLDQRSTLYYDYNGRIYIIPDLTPATAYYVRAYAMTKNYAVGYGEPIKVVTIPRGGITWWYNNGADGDANNRINNAIRTAVDTWNRYASISGLNISCTYGSGTPTADCSYGGNMRIGPSVSYQQTGTVMHEMLHAIGVGTSNFWWDGIWRGKGNRNAEVLNFWDNKTDGELSGDSQHLWPYGINGAHEDNGSEILYIVNSMLAQALWEDGLPVTNGAFACPAYVFPQKDGVKYYLKNENEAFGRLSSYLCVTSTNTLAWEEMDSEAAQAYDRAAWYVSFDPSTRCYTLQNVGTKRYLNASASMQISATKLQLMRGRVDVEAGTNTLRGYWLLSPSGGTRNALTASDNGALKAQAYDLGNAASAQRWLILTAEEATAFDKLYAAQLKTEMTAFVKEARTVLQTSHDAAAGVDEAFDAALTQAAQTATSGNASQMRSALSSLREALITFLASTKPTDGGYYDLTFLIKNPGFDTDASGWQTTATPTNLLVSSIEFYQKTFDCYQTLVDMPAGRYTVLAQAYQRPGNAATAYEKRNTTSAITSYLYLNSTSTRLKNITADAQSTQLYENDSNPATDVWFPNTMQGAAVYLAKNLYENEVTTKLSAKGSLKFGIRCTSSGDYYWTLFDNFRLHYYGDDTLVGTPVLVETPVKAPWYDLSGRKIEDRLCRGFKGVYIVGGKKVVR